MKKIVIMVASICLIVTSFIVTNYIKKSAKKATYTIGILQTASHPALDAVRDGFVAELKKCKGDDVDLLIYNAQGSIVNVHAIAQQLCAYQHIDAFFAIATPAAQALATLEKKRPIVIAAVTDPYALGLIHPTTNVCGMQDMIDVVATVEMLTQLVPQAKTVGLIYSSGEANSIALTKHMRTQLIAKGLTVTDFAFSGELDIATTTELACRKTDVILAPTDNLVASSIALIVAIAHKYKKSLIVSDNMLVAQGALAARGVDYKESGKQAGITACKILIAGKKPHELSIEQSLCEHIFVNQKTLALLGLSIPQELQKHVVLVS